MALIEQLPGETPAHFRARLAIQHLFQGETLVEAIKKAKADNYSFYLELKNDPSLAAEYASAQQFRAELSVANLEDHIKNDPDAARVRNLMQHTHWRAERLLRTVYAPSVDVNVTQQINISAALKEAQARVSLPQRDQQTLEAPQVLDMSRLSILRSTDKQSVDTPIDDPDDIFS